ncbi:hypothetical protein BaRGS_00027930 [Batillaria attramentaria]|uniref:Uncharacterized protein n=1 Tax=Batillaria attramentaria TaxID=370345 RepID=A0ABD0K0J2_9CAEN
MLAPPVTPDSAPLTPAIPVTTGPRPDSFQVDVEGTDGVPTSPQLATTLALTDASSLTAKGAPGSPGKKGTPAKKTRSTAAVAPYLVSQPPSSATSTTNTSSTTGTGQPPVPQVPAPVAPTTGEVIERKSPPPETSGTIISSS